MARSAAHSIFMSHANMCVIVFNLFLVDIVKNHAQFDGDVYLL